MKLSLYLLFVACNLLLFTFSAAPAWPDAPSLVPPSLPQTSNYWCTWYAQNYWIGRGTDLNTVKEVTNQAAREELNEHTLFNNQDGWATNFLKEGRQDYIFLIDHGWQTKDKSERIAGGPAFFNLVADERDFPKYAGLEPKKVLKQFNQDIKAQGWNSLGIWTRGNVSPDQARTFVEWSKYAGITYWKIDGGDTVEFNSFKAKQEIYPELILEYVTGAGGNLNPKWDQALPAYPSVFDIGGRLHKPMLRCLEKADTFRTYDSSPLLMSVTTVRRTHDILKQTQQQPKYRAILNVQDDCNLAIGLGVLVASKRHPNYMERTYKGKDLHHQLSGPRRMQNRIDEVLRFGRWARIAPAFSAGEGVYLSSDLELIDRCSFTEWDTWAKNTYGKMVSQSAPAVVARNMPLPEVECAGEPPFVCATTYPNGPTGIATEGRVSPENQWFHPRANVTVKIKDASQPIGIAGHYDQLILEFAGPVENVSHVWAQDLLADRAVDIRSQVEVVNNRVILPGTLIDRVGTSAGHPDDISAPGMVIRLEGTHLPIANSDFTPRTEPVTVGQQVAKKALEQADGYFGTANLAVHPYGYCVTASDDAQVALKQLPKGITSGKFSVSWKMKPMSRRPKNGFLVLSSDEDAKAALCAGLWIGSNEMTLFENDSTWGNDLARPCSLGQEADCRVEVDLDMRTATLTVAGKVLDLAFSESLTSINYIGFGVHRADTLFTKPKIQQ